MSITDALLAAIGSEEDGIQGRTLLQKRMYFLSVLVKEDFQFTPYYYGPYSSRVADQLGALREAAFVSEQSELYGTSGPFGEMRRFDYRLTPAGKQLVDRHSEDMKVYNEALGRISNHRIASDTRLLSTAAKVHFIVSEHGRATVPEIQRWAKELGWSVEPKQVDLVVNYLEHLDLVEAQRESPS